MSSTSNNTNTGETTPSMIVQNEKRLDVGVLGDISKWYGYNARQLQNRLSGKKDVTNIDVYVCSNGGSLDEAMKMFEMLKGHPATVTCYLFGVVASSASFLSCCADKVIASKRTIYMVHNPSYGAYGTSKVLKSAYKAVEAFRQIAVEAYVEKSGIDVESMETLMDEESYMSPETAKQLGFIDEIVDTIEFPFTIPSSYYGMYEDDYYMKSKDGGWLSERAVYTTSFINMKEKGFEEHKPSLQNLSGTNMKKINVKGFIQMLVNSGFIAKEKASEAEKSISEEDLTEMVIVEDEPLLEKVKALDENGLAEMRNLLGVEKPKGNESEEVDMKVLFDSFETQMKNLTTQNEALSKSLTDMKEKMSKGGNRRPSTNGEQDLGEERESFKMKAKLADGQIKHLAGMVSNGSMSKEEFEEMVGVSYDQVEIV